MFWKNKEMEDQVSSMTQKIAGYVHMIRQLEKQNSKFKTENELLNKQVIKYQAICREQTPVVKGKFKPATTSSEAMNMFKGQFKGDFYCLDDVEVDILNVFLQKIHALKIGTYQPNTKAIASCDEFFNFNKVLTKREYLAMLYALLDIKVTSRRFESFDSEVGKDEVISIIEKLFAYIEAESNDTNRSSR
jgi:hypothetical protein